MAPRYTAADADNRCDTYGRTAAPSIRPNVGAMIAPVSIRANAMMTPLGGKAEVPRAARSNPRTTTMRVNDVMVIASTGMSARKKNHKSRSTGEPSLGCVSRAPAASLTGAERIPRRPDVEYLQREADIFE